MNKFIITYGKNLYNDNYYINSGYIPELYINDIDKIINYLIDIEKINLNIYKYKIIYRNCEKNFKLNWHIDDYYVYKHSKKNNINRYDIKKYNDDILHYSCIIYLSDYDIDFTGGFLEFINGKIYKPVKYKYILFDSRIMHKVHKVTNGIRKTILIKFYKI